jgi:hypothetical protein
MNAFEREFLYRREYKRWRRTASIRQRRVLRLFYLFALLGIAIVFAMLRGAPGEPDEGYRSSLDVSLGHFECEAGDYGKIDPTRSPQCIWVEKGESQ